MRDTVELKLPEKDAAVTHSLCFQYRKRVVFQHVYMPVFISPQMQHTHTYIWDAVSVYSPMAMFMPNMCDLKFNCLIFLFMSFSNVSSVPKALLNFYGFENVMFSCACM